MELRFRPSRGLVIGERTGGRLIALGREEAPIILRGTQEGPGAWPGVLLRPGTLPNTNLKHVIIEGAGAPQQRSRACLNLENFGTDIVSLEAITLKSCEQAGLAIRSGAPLLFEDLRIEDSEIGAMLAPKNVADVPASTTYRDVLYNQIDQGAVTTDAVWRAQAVPYRPTGDLFVEGNASPALTLEPGVELQFAPGAQMVVGEAQPGALLAQGAQDKPITLGARSDPWRGLRIGRLGTATLSRVTFQGGGLPIPGVLGCLTVEAALSDAVSVDDSRFEDCLQSGVATAASATPLASFSANTFARCEAGVRVLPSMVGSVEPNQTYESTPYNVIVSGQVTDSATWSPQEVPWRALGPILVTGQRSPLLSMQPGLHVVFDAAAWLSVGDIQPGGLDARGTEAQPIILSSTSDQPGAWRGVGLQERLTAATLEHVHIQDGGLSGFGFSGCLTVSSERPQSVRVERSRFSDCARAGVTVSSQTAPFSAFSENTIERAPVGLAVSAAVVGALTEPQTYVDIERNLITTGDVREDATWSAQPVPWQVQGLIRIGGFDDPTLTIEPGLQLGFETGALIEIGLLGPGSLVARGTQTSSITLESAMPEPAMGDWHGIIVGPLTTQVTLSDLTIQHAGQEAALIRAAISLLDTDERVFIERVRFTNNAKADLFVDCMSNPNLLDNVYESDGGLLLERCE